MRLFTTTQFDDVARAGDLCAALEGVGYDGVFSYETKHDPFVPLALGAPRTSKLLLGTGVAIAFARSPMTIANTAYDIQDISGGRFVLGLGSQIRPHIERRFSMPWSKPAARMRELVLAIRAIWDAWEGIAPLRFEGEFYRLTLMTPAFSPGPFRFGRPPIYVAGVGPRMTEAACEVGDGVMVHPFNTRRSLEELTFPAIARGRARAGTPASSGGRFEKIVLCLVATGTDGPDFDEAVATVREMLAFYGSTPAYAAVLAVHGWEGVHHRLNELSKEGRWADMAGLVTDEMLETIAVVGRRNEIAALVDEKTAGLADSVGIECTRRPDPGHFADIVADLRQRWGAPAV